jgi:malate dehydrogenase
MPRPIVGVVGAGNVGASAALMMLKKDLCDVVLCDIPQVEGMPQGKALDMSESRQVDYHDAKAWGTTRVEDLKECSIVCITAGVPRKPGMTREQLLEVNANIIRDVTGKLKGAGATPILIVVTNPLDVMTYAALRLTGFPRERVLGMAGVLDSNRFAHFVAEELKVSPKDVSAMVLGSHGDTMVAMPRFTTVAGIPITELLPKERIDALAQRTRDGGIEIVNLLKTGSAYYAPGSSIVAMVEAILHDSNRVLPCSVLLKGEYGLDDVVVGVPCKIGEGGLKQILQLRLTPEEDAALKRSAAVVKENIRALKF